MVAAPQAGSVRSQRGRRRQPPPETALEQIRMQPNGVTGAWAYYLRPDGATIRDALILYPNGGAPPASQDPKGKFGTNAAYFRERQRAKGFTYLGQHLTQDGVRLLVDTIARNRGDEVLFCEDEIADCDQVIENSDRPETRDLYRRRKLALETRLATLQMEFDPDALVAELDEIARAQRLASVDPNVLAVMREMVGEVNENFARAINKFSAGKQSASDPEMAGTPRGRRMKVAGDADAYQGMDAIEAGDA